MEQLLFFRVSDDLVALAMQLIETSDEVIVISASEPSDCPEPRIIYANDAFVKDSGYTKEEVIGQSSHILYGPKTNKAALKRIEYSIEQRYGAREKILNYKKNGDKHWQVINIVPIANKAWQKTLFAAVKDKLKTKDLTRKTYSKFKYTLELRSKANDLLTLD